MTKSLAGIWKRLWRRLEKSLPARRRLAPLEALALRAAGGRNPRQARQAALRRFLGLRDFHSPWRRLLEARVPRDPRFVFVLLQYGSIDHTKRCLDSIARLRAGWNVSVVLVDNFSTPENTEATRALEGSHPQLHILFRTTNDGYARGNNEGVRWAREHLSPDFVLVFNNDIVLTGPMFFEHIVRAYRKTGFSLLGPDIVVPLDTGSLHQNPGSLGSLDTADIVRRIERIGTGTSPPRIPGRRRRTARPTDHAELHGAALVLSPVFLADFDVPFDPRTFLYQEERILYLRALARGHRQVYWPALRVLHNTTLALYKHTPQYMSWRQGIMADSLRVLLSVARELETSAQEARDNDAIR